MARRDLLYSVIGHVIFGCVLLFLSPISAGLWGKEQPKPLIIPVTLVGPAPGLRSAVRPQTAAVAIAKPAKENKQTIKPPEKPKPDKLAEKRRADSTKTANQAAAARKDTTKLLAAKDVPDRTGEMSHTIIEGASEEGADEIFGENIPAAGYGATDPYFQSLFLAIQRAFRNPVPGYKTVRCVVVFTVMRNGAIAEIKLESSSGIPRFDRAAIVAIESIEWGRPFPNQFHDYDGFHIRMPFEYVPR